jgi:hypothetical protein
MELKRIIKNKPAVTSVEECTKAEMGVGAAIAAGNQDENGKIADLVIEPKRKMNSIIIMLAWDEYAKLNGKVDGSDLRHNTIAKIIKESPKRLTNKVKSPEKILLLSA